MHPRIATTAMGLGSVPTPWPRGPTRRIPRLRSRREEMRTVRVAVAIAAGLGLLLLGWFQIANEEVPPAPSESGTLTEAVALSPSTTKKVDADESASTIERQAAALAERLCEIRVVVSGSGEPAAAAVVEFLPRGTDWAQFARDRLRATPAELEAELQPLRSMVRTDAEGTCRIPAADFTSVIARKNGLVGRASAQRGRVVTIELRVDCTLRVLVLDDVGVPVRDAAVMMRWGNRVEAPLGTTDATGRVVVPQVGELAIPGSGYEASVFVRFVGGDTTGIPVDLTVPQAEIVVRLPRCGHVAVHVRDAAGRPVDPALDAVGDVTLSSWRSKPLSGAIPVDASGRARLDANGDALFGGVEVGRYVMAQTNDGRRSAVVVGPTREQPRVDITLQESPDTAVLTGVLLGSDDRPLGKVQYSVGCIADGVRTGVLGTTDPRGRFRAALRDPIDDSAATITFSRFDGAAKQDVGIELAPRRVTRGENDLGAIRLEAAKLLLAAKLVSADGSEPPPLHMYVVRRGAARNAQEAARKTWDKSGAFTFVGTAPAGTPMRLVVEAAGFLPIAPLDFLAGATGVEIPLRRGGSVAATFVVDPSLAIDRLEIRCRNVDPTAQLGEFVRILESRAMESLARQRPPPEVLRREWSGLAPGTYRLQAFHDGAPTPIAQVDAIVVGEGPCPDPRLERIELPRITNNFSIRVTTTDGAPIASWNSVLVVRGDREGWRGYQLGGDGVSLAVPAPVDVVLVSDDVETTFVNGVFESRTIVMKPAARQPVRVTLASALPEGATLHLQFVPRVEGGDVPVGFDDQRQITVAGASTARLSLDASGQAEFAVRVPGPHAVTGWVTIGQRNVPVRVEPASLVLPDTSDVVVAVPDSEWGHAASRK